MFANRIAQTVIAFVLTFTTVFTVMSPSATACGIESPQRVSQCVRMVNTSLDAIEREGKKVRHLRDSLLEQARHASPQQARGLYQQARRVDIELERHRDNYRRVRRVLVSLEQVLRNPNMHDHRVRAHIITLLKEAVSVIEQTQGPSAQTQQIRQALDVLGLVNVVAGTFDAMNGR